MSSQDSFIVQIVGRLIVGLFLVSGSFQVSAGWQLVWNDEFESNSLNPNKWTPEVGNGFYSGTTYIYGWGNNELEYYTARVQNLFASNGVLHLVARQESYQGFNYTSGRVSSLGHFATEYGRVEFRAKLPSGLGYWPALWLMPENPIYGSWPASGEIDVMENRGSAPSTVSGTIHYGSPGHDVYSQQTYVLPNPGTVTSFHVYRIDWNTNSIQWYVDGKLYETQTNWFTSSAPYPAPFDNPFYLIMNLSVGGNFLNNPGTNVINANTPFPGDEQVDYVRVFHWSSLPEQVPILTAKTEVGETIIAGSNGFPNAPFLLLSATNPTQVANSWSIVLSNAFDVAGTFRWTNPISSEASFFRVSVP